MIIGRYLNRKKHIFRTLFYDRSNSPIPTNILKSNKLSYIFQRNYAKKKLNFGVEVKPTGGLFNIDKSSHDMYDKIKSCKSISGRNIHGEFIIENIDFILQALKAKAPLSSIIIPESKYTDEITNQLSTFEHSLPIYTIKDSLFTKLFPNDTPNSIAICSKLHKNFETIDSFKDMKNILLLDTVLNPRNIGMNLRSAEAFKIDGLFLLTKNNATEAGNIEDILYSRLSIKASRGAIFRVPFIHIDKKQLFSFAEQYNFELICTTPHKIPEKPIYQLKKTKKKKGNKKLSEISKPTTEKGKIIIVGNESYGVQNSLLKASHRIITIPTAIESLNVAVTVGIVLYKLTTYEKLHSENENKDDDND